MKNFFIGLIIILLVGFGIYFTTRDSKDSSNVATPTPTPSSNVDMAGGTTATSTTTGAGTSTTTPSVGASADTSKVVNGIRQTTIGTSLNGTAINAYHFSANGAAVSATASGEKEILFVGGIHGGYSWNTSLVAYELIDYLKKNPSAVPAGVKVTVIPSVNPDGLTKVIGEKLVTLSTTDVSQHFVAPDTLGTPQSIQIAGRFNANKVDLNRNFDCDWQANGKWQNTTVSGGTAPFSEPESRAVKNYIESHDIAAAVVWYSAAGGVYSSSCHNGVLAETRTLTNIYADASGYPANEDFDFYAITGDMTNWLAKKSIPAISVLLTDHQNTEWSKNLAGIKAVLAKYK